MFLSTGDYCPQSVALPLSEIRNRASIALAAGAASSEQSSTVEAGISRFDVLKLGSGFSGKAGSAGVMLPSDQGATVASLEAVHPQSP
jgi:hypothetical protein